MRKLSTIIMAIIVFLSCANPGIPSGGEKDETPPQITNTNPENYTTNFNASKIVLNFNEFVKLDNAAKNVIISPPQKKKPKVRLKEKQIVVELRDSLRKNTTYTIDFGKAIVDNNEGNLLGEYRYVFSTGDKIDKMGLAGYVKGAHIDTVVQQATVALYIPSDTLNPYLRIPDYIAQTDTLGFFMFNNIVDAEYKIIAFQDENNNTMLDPQEPLAFLENNIHTSEAPKEEADSIQLDKYTLFKNTELQLRVFKPVETQQYLKEYKRPLPEQLNFVFNAPRKDSLGIEILNTAENITFYREANEQNDSLTYWIGNKNIASQDTLRIKLSYLRTDSLEKLVPYNDTLKLNYKAPKKTKEEKKEEDNGEKIEFMNIKTNMSSRINYFDSLTLTFERPVTTLKKDDVFIFTKQDTIESPVTFELKEDSMLPHRKYQVIMPMKPNEKYNIRIDSMKVYDSGNRPNQKLENSFETYDESYYGKLFVTVIDGDEGLLIQIVNKQNPNIVIAQQEWQKDKVLEFTNLPPDTYLLKALWDTNGNGKWDIGDYKAQRQPERVQFFAKEIQLRSNWEQEVSWTLKKRKQ